MSVVKINTLEGYELFDGYEIDCEGNVYTYYKRGMNRKYKNSIDWNASPVKLNPTMKNNGYLHLGLRDINGKSKYPTIHRLLALAFIDNPLKLPVVNHKNGNKFDNRLENLEWTDHKGNTAHAFSTGLITRSMNGLNRPVNQYDLDGNFIKRYEYIADAIEEIGMKPSSKSAITRVCQGKQKTSGGFLWKYAKQAKGSTTS